MRLSPYALTRRKVDSGGLANSQLGIDVPPSGGAGRDPSPDHVHVRLGTHRHWVRHPGGTISVEPHELLHDALEPGVNVDLFVVKRERVLRHQGDFSTFPYSRVTVGQHYATQALAVHYVFLRHDSER